MVTFSRIPLHYKWTTHAIEKLEERGQYRNQHELELALIYEKWSRVLDLKTWNITRHLKNARVVLDREETTIITIMDRICDTPKSVRRKHRKRHKFINQF